jgi:hypothetical protein
MGIAKIEEALFRRWSEGRDSFVRDGAVLESAFEAASPSMLFLLKEVNDPGPNGGGWDLRELIREGDRPQTWDNLCRWVQGINGLPNDTPWRDLESITQVQRREVLKSIAAMNLKKSPGGHTTVVSSFWQAVHADADLLREQFAIYDADLVICCGSVVAEAFDSVLKPSDDSAWRMTSRGVEFLEYSPGKHVIAYSHPEARVADNLLHYGLMDAVVELRDVLTTN